MKNRTIARDLGQIVLIGNRTIARTVLIESVLLEDPLYLMQNQSNDIKYSNITRPLVRAGGTGGMPPVNFEQLVASTRPEITNLSSTFSMYLYGSDLDKKMQLCHPSCKIPNEGPETPGDSKLFLFPKKFTNASFDYITEKMISFFTHFQDYF